MGADKFVHEPLDHADHVRKLISYFEDAHRDYRRWWITSTALAMHFGFYDQDTSNHAEALLNMNRVLAMRAELHSSDRVLDAGCGVGGSAIWLARELGVRVVGINVVPGDIDRARRYARRRKVARLSCCRTPLRRRIRHLRATCGARLAAIWRSAGLDHLLDPSLVL